MTETRKMFLAGPFKALVDSDIHVMRGSDIDKYASIIDYFETRGWDVHCAHRREDWGRDFMEPSECTRIDYTEIAACDVFIAFPGSPGTRNTYRDRVGIGLEETHHPSPGEGPGIRIPHPGSLSGRRRGNDHHRPPAGNRTAHPRRH